MIDWGVVVDMRNAMDALAGAGVRPARIEMGAALHAALVHAAEASSGRKIERPIPGWIWGIPVELPPGMDPATWRAVDRDGNEIGSGVIG